MKSSCCREILSGNSKKRRDSAEHSEESFPFLGFGIIPCRRRIACGLFLFCRKASKNCQKLPLLLKGQKKRPFFCTHFKLKLFYNKYRRRRTPSFRQIFSLGGGESVAVLSMGKRVARGEGTGSRSRYLRKIENKKTKRKEIYFYDH